MNPAGRQSFAFREPLLYLRSQQSSDASFDPVSGGRLMHRTLWFVPALATVLLFAGLSAPAADNTAPDGFTSLFNGKDLTGWKIPAGDNGHWKVVDGVIDCDAKSESKVPDKSLWSEKSFK